MKTQIKLFRLLALLFFTLPTFAQQTQIKVEAGDYPRKQSIITLALPISYNQKNYQLENLRTGKKAIIQQKKDNLYTFILPDELAAKSTAVYKITEVKNSKTSKNLVKLSKNAEKIEVKIADKKLFDYHIQTVYPPKGFPDYYARSGFIHPLYSPNGSVLTDDFPKGHMHQHGIMMALTNTTFKGEKHDFWNQHSKLANVKHTEVLAIEEGPVFSSFKVKHQHYSLKYGAVLDEIWTVRVYSFQNKFLFDIVSELENITKDTLFVNKYHYGGMAFRASKHWNIDDSLHYQNKWQIKTNNGDDVATANAKAAKYVSASGLLNGKTAGLTVFGFPQNLAYPQPIRLHPTMPYFSFSPMVNAAFTIKPQEVFTSQYRYLSHDDLPQEKYIESLNADIEFPPVVKFIP
ncbi:hypothetical protein FYC62_06505 [Pedobacter aquae]|uniref:Methane monooxygenase PmoA-like n=1 Tax=Pedobacter aquae TaxID=2605747 RepID=A0A5C0VH31_9SPHI|nr:PmoA family protein [Pedobacter aquae]QEK51357.1 hypothetical protein FYC62_06505 [Pedobacter aquae]